MAVIRSSRRIERAGVNALRALLDDHDQLAQEINGENDHGEDLFVMLTANGRRTGHVISVQVKSGQKYKRASGYAIPVDRHFEDWKESRVPVIGVVYDNELRCLFWVNLTQFLRACDDPPSWVPVSRDNELSGASLRGFVAEVQTYIDAKGMRVRATTDSDSILSTSVARRASSSRNEEESSPDDAPNPMFDGIADMVLRNKKTLRAIKRSLWLVSLALVMVVVWPYQVRFVEANSDMSPVVWVGNLQLFTFYLAMTIFFEFRAGRLPDNAGRFFSLILSNFYLVIPFMVFMGDGESDGWWGTSWIVAGVIVPSAGYKLILMKYVGDAIRRRKSRE